MGQSSQTNNGIPAWATQKNGNAREKIKTVAGQIPFKPGLHPFHQRHLGEKINFDSLYKIVVKKHHSPSHCGLGDNIVYGFHPYWMGSAWKSYNFKLLSHIAYFAYDINVLTGAPSSIHDWATTPMVDSAKAAGVKVHLTITTVGSNGRTRDMLNNPTAAKTCIDSVAYWVSRRKADGINIDFEDMSSQDTSAFTSWVTQLKARLRKDNPDAEITVAGASLGQQTIFNLPGLYPILDYMVIMGYDYFYSGSPTAGCTAPVPGNPRNLNLASTIDTYTKNGFGAEKLVLALPYYGYEWQTSGLTNSNNSVISYKATPTFRELMDRIVGTYDANWDSASTSSYYTAVVSGTNRQAWVIDSLSMASRFQLVKDKKIAGMGMWALGYDNGYTQLWDLIYEKFTECDSTPKNSANSIPHKPKQADASASNEPLFFVGYRWLVPWILIITFLLIAFIVWRDRKAREEVLNRYWLFPLGAMAILVIVVAGYEFGLNAIDCAECSFTWFALIAFFGLLLGFWFGRKWNSWRKDDF